MRRQIIENERHTGVDHLIGIFHCILNSSYNDDYTNYFLLTFRQSVNILEYIRTFKGEITNLWQTKRPLP